MSSNRPKRHNIANYLASLTAEQRAELNARARAGVKAYYARIDASARNRRTWLSLSPEGKARQLAALARGRANAIAARRAKAAAKQSAASG